MMEKQTKSPIGILAGALAAMTERACEAERQLYAAKEDAKNWYDLYQSRDAKVKELEAKLANETEERKKAQRQLQISLGDPVLNGRG